MNWNFLESLKLSRKRLMYLDWAAAAPVSKEAREAFLKAFDAQGNPGSPHAEGMRAKKILEDSRRTIARIVGVKTDGVIFTSGATEANALAIHGHVHALLDSGKDDSEMKSKKEKRTPDQIHVLYLPTAHASVVETMHELAKRGVMVEELRITNGAVDVAALKTQIRPETALVSMDVVCGETGTRWDTRDVRRVLDAARAEARASGAGSRILLHVDASQAPFIESIEVTHLGADLMTLDAQKVGGVRGIGALIRTHPLIPLASIMQGGGQEQGLRPGTESPALASAFAAALASAQEAKAREAFNSRSLRLRDELLATLTTAFPDMVVNSAKVKGGASGAKGNGGAAHILNISFPKLTSSSPLDTDYTVMLLSEAGFAVSTKSACETDAVGSRAVLALTKTLAGNAESSADSAAQARALSTLRISWGPTTRAKSLRDFARILARIITFQNTTQL
jgi:cysteine desulfurase